LQLAILKKKILQLAGRLEGSPWLSASAIGGGLLGFGYAAGWGILLMIYRRRRYDDFAVSVSFSDPITFTRRCDLDEVLSRRDTHVHEMLLSSEAPCLMMDKPHADV
jgi:hypothetical protein